NRVVVEVKSTLTLSPADRRQLKNFLRVTVPRATMIRPLPFNPGNPGSRRCQAATTARIRTNYTTFPFHLPVLNTTALTTASVENATVIAMNTPNAPSPVWCDSTHASGISNTQNTNRLIHVGVRVSPAPLNEFPITIPYA